MVSSLARIGAPKTQELADRALVAVGIERAVTELQTADDVSNIVQERLNDDAVTDILSDIDVEYYGLDEDIAALLFAFIKEDVRQFS